MELVFVARFWFSNIAWFNEIKRFSKLEIKDFTNSIVSEIMSEMEMNLTKVAQNDKNNKIGHWNYELGENLSDLIEKVTTEIWNEYNLLVQDLLYEGEGDVELFLYHIDDDRLIQELENIKKSCLINKDIN